jgi:aminoacylase
VFPYVYLIENFLTFSLPTLLSKIKEVGGGGMAAFLESKLYKSLPGIALALDEGLANPADTFSLFYGERLPWWVNVTATGPTGHGSRFIENTAVEQLIALANRALEFRQGQRSLLGMKSHENCTHAVVAAKNSKTATLGDVTSLNITTLQAGVQVGDTYAYNCVPPVAKCSLDIRISPHTPPSEISAMLDQWCIECSSNGTMDANTSVTPSLSWNYIGGHGNDLQKHALTSTDPKENPWYNVFESAIKSMGMKLEPQVFPAATDSRFLRALGIRAFGFSPMRNTEILLHENNEYIPESIFLEGISVYVTLIMALGSKGNDIEVQL